MRFNLTHFDSFYNLGKGEVLIPYGVGWGWDVRQHLQVMLFDFIGAEIKNP